MNTPPPSPPRSASPRTIPGRAGWPPYFPGLAASHWDAVFDGIATSRLPIALTQIGARALANSNRMALDEVLQACADKGAVIGIEGGPPHHREPEHVAGLENPTGGSSTSGDLAVTHPVLQAASRRITYFLSMAPLRHFLSALLVAATLALPARGPSPLLAQVTAPVAATATDFSRLVSRLSEDGGFFASDNLVSNETSYLHALDGFRTHGVKGGAYVGVGPEQGFSYIAELEPRIAIILDIRRDNMVLHLLLKAMFETARNRLEYLGLLYGRPVPEDAYLWTEHDLPSLLDYLDRTPADSVLHRRQHLSLMRRVESYGIPLTEADRAAGRAFHDEFAAAGLDLRYATRGRPSRFSFPSERRLYLETDLAGNFGSYLSTEDRWRRVRDLHRANRIIPVVGDLSGPTAVRAVGRYLREINTPVSALYLSNVESYLFRYGTFPDFVANLRALPITGRSVMVRSWFGRGSALPSSVAGHFSTQLLQSFESFLEMTRAPEQVEYWMLLDAGLPLRPPLTPAEAPPGD